MFAILGQGRDGLNWLANAPTKERARDEAAAIDQENYDFLLIVPLAGFVDVDGEERGSATVQMFD